MPDKTVAVNRRARHEYAVEETLEAGIVLTGTEIKSIRAGRVNLAEAYARIEQGRGVARSARTSPPTSRAIATTTSRRGPGSCCSIGTRSPSWSGRDPGKGLTLVPLQLYIRDGMAKLEIGMARGKKAHDKRRTIAERDARRELEREAHRNARIKL